MNSALDVIVVRKLGVPRHPELAMGAIGEGGIKFIDQPLVERLGITDYQISRVEARERVELARRIDEFRTGPPALELHDRTVVLIDDGIATGSTARVACQVARSAAAGRIVLAVPVAAPGWENRLSDVADELIAVATPGRFRSIGSFYRDFSQTSSEEVVRLLSAH